MKFFNCRLLIEKNLFTDNDQFIEKKEKSVKLSTKISLIIKKKKSKQMIKTNNQSNCCLKRMAMGVENVENGETRAKMVQHWKVGLELDFFLKLTNLY